MNEHDLRQKRRSIIRFESGTAKSLEDALAAEEPFEIRVVFGSESKRKSRSLSITMRTPGNDRELAAGFLVGEGIVRKKDDISAFEETGTPVDGSEHTNQLCVHLAENVLFDFDSLQRNFFTTSSCGICGKASLDAVRAHLGEPIVGPFPEVSSSVICQLPLLLRQQQETFSQTGGLHAAGLFDRSGELSCSFEDVGRHNALDKLIGSRYLVNALPMSQDIIVVSGRASFELVQKTIAAGVAVLVAVGAPSSLAAELADEFGVTLVGFASPCRFNVYSHPHRILMQ